jgi:ketosteroid isomerase-like protein
MNARNAETPLVRRAVEALSRGGGLPLCDSIVDCGVRWREPGRSLVAGDYIGCDEVATALFGRLAELSDGTFRVATWEAVTTGADHETGMYVSSARRNGHDLLSRDVCVAEIRDGRIVRAQAYHADQRAWDAFWS